MGTSANHQAVQRGEGSGGNFGWILFWSPNCFSYHTCTKRVTPDLEIPSNLQPQHYYKVGVVIKSGLAPPGLDEIRTLPAHWLQPSSITPSYVWDDSTVATGAPVSFWTVTSFGLCVPTRRAKFNKLQNRRTSLSVSSAFQKASLDPDMFLDLQVDLLDRQNSKKKKIRLDPRVISGGLDA